MAYKTGSDGIDRTNAEPVDVAALHSKDVGMVAGIHVDDFIEEFYQPPLSRYFGTVDVESVEGLPALKSIEYIQQKSAEAEGVLSSDKAKQLVKVFGTTSIKDFQTKANDPNSKESCCYKNIKTIVQLFQAYGDEFGKYVSMVKRNFDINWEGNISNA